MVSMLAARAGFVLAHYAFLLLFGFLSFLCGHVLLRRMHFASLGERISLSTALGLGVMAHLLFLLGTVGLLYRWAVLATLGLWLLILGRGHLIELARSCRRFRWWGGRDMALALLVVLILGPLLLLPLYPPSAWDSTEFYLASSKIYVSQHALVLTPYLRFEVYPQLCQLLFTFALLFSDDVAAQLTQFLMLLVLLGAVYSLGCRYFTTRAALWAAALLLGSPLMLYLGSIAYIDIGVTLYLTLAFYALVVWQQVISRRGSCFARASVDLPSALNIPRSLLWLSLV